MSDATPQAPETGETQTRTNQLKIYADDDEAAMANAVATARDCSTSAVGRALFRDEFERLFGDALDPTDIREGRVSDEDLRAVARGDLEVDDLELGDDETDEDVGDRDPASYSAGATPEQLSSEGAPLCYDILREAVADPVEGGLWSEDLEIHPDRVAEFHEEVLTDGMDPDPGRVEKFGLKQNHKTTSRVLVAMARSKMTDNRTIFEGQIDNLVEQHVAHIPRSMDREAALERATEVYSEMTKDHFISHPVKPVFYTSDGFGEAIKELITDLSDADLSDRDPGVIEDAINARAFAFEFTETLLDTETDRSEPHAYAALHEVASDVFDALEDLDDSEQIELLSEVDDEHLDAELWSPDPDVPDSDYDLDVVEHLGLKKAE